MRFTLNNKLLTCLCLTGLIFSIPFHLSGKEPIVEIGRFSEGIMEGWTTKKFSGQTEYTLVAREGQKVIKAVSNQSASGLFKEIRVDLDKTPYLNWQWTIDNILNIKNEKTKSGDDYPARVYIVVKTGWFPWDLNAVSYVWSSISPIDTQWTSAFSKNACMIVVESGADKLKSWTAEKRNIQMDYQECFNQKIQYIDAVAIMTDTDNSKTKAVAYYGDIYFSAR